MPKDNDVLHALENARLSCEIAGHTVEAARLQVNAATDAVLAERRTVFVGRVDHDLPPIHISVNAPRKIARNGEYVRSAPWSVDVQIGDDVHVIPIPYPNNPSPPKVDVDAYDVRVRREK